MDFQKTGSDWIFRAAAAVTAAAAADPVVERLSDAGFFGAGHFTDRSTIDVLPAVLIASALSAIFVALLARRMLGRSVHAPQWLRTFAAGIAARRLSRTLPSIFGMQIAVLYAMETLEQIAVTGHPLGGTLWLGGPLAAALAIHAIACVLLTWVLAQVVAWSARSIVRAVRFALQLLRTLFASDAAPPVHIRDFKRSKCIEPYLRVLHGRAPPVLSAF